MNERYTSCRVTRVTPQCWAVPRSKASSTPIFLTAEIQQHTHLEVCVPKGHLKVCGLLKDMTRLHALPVAVDGAAEAAELLGEGVVDLSGASLNVLHLI